MHKASVGRSNLSRTKDVIFGLAPFSSKTCAVAEWPLADARCNAVALKAVARKSTQFDTTVRSASFLGASRCV